MYGELNAKQYMRSQYGNWTGNDEGMSKTTVLYTGI